MCMLTHSVPTRGADIHSKLEILALTSYLPIHVVNKSIIVDQYQALIQMADVDKAAAAKQVSTLHNITV